MAAPKKSKRAFRASPRMPRDPRWLFFGAALAIATGASFVAFQQDLRLDPLHAPPLFTPAWWKYPLEANAIRRLTLIGADVRDITVAPGTNALWIVGHGGLLASSRDGGRTWQRREIFGASTQTNAVSPMPSATSSPAASPLPSASNYPSASPGPNPPPTFAPSASPPRSPPPKKASLEDRNEYRHVALRAEESQTTPIPQRSKQDPQQGPRQMIVPSSPSPDPLPLSKQESAERVFPDLETISFYDRDHGCAVGKNGAIALTTNGGETWSAQYVPDRPRLVAVRFDSVNEGTALSSLYNFFITKNAGIYWSRMTDVIVSKLFGEEEESESGFIVSKTEAWGQRDANIYRTTDGPLAWSITDAAAPVFIPLAAGNGHIGWTGSRERPAKMRMLNQRPAGPPSVPPQIKSVLFPTNDKDAWAVGDYGTVLATTDAGKSWRWLALSPTSELRREWLDAGNHRSFPAPWYYLVCLVSLGLCIPVLRRPASVTEKSSVADILASDRPIEPGEPDPLQFNAVALALSRFLRNANTTPPLSIDITGEWGTGKSSLMNLLRGDLRARGFRPVWFNPWHHQKEEHLLAALLENIQAQAIPPGLSLQGLSYRLALVWFRARRYWRISLVLAVIVAGFAGYFAVDPSRMVRVANELRSFTIGIADYIGGRLKRPEPPKSTLKPSAAGDASSPAAEAAKNQAAVSATALRVIGEILMPENASRESSDESPGPAAFVLVTSLLGSIVALVKALRSFGVNASALLATSAARPRLRDLKAETSFRYKFAGEFSDVTGALRAFNRRTMLILIDDLDRCRPESVVEMLEAVNFLITCGDCFIVIGMARERVERCVGLAFKDMAEEVFGQTTGENPAKQDEERKKRRAEFARQYLEKLINIEVPVPEATSEQSRELLARDEEVVGARRRVRKLRLRGLARAAALTLVALLLLGAAFVAGQILFPNRATQTDGSAASVQSISQLQVSAPQENVWPSDTAPASESAPATLDSARPGGTASWAFWPLIAALLGAGIWSMLLVPANVVYDSAEFSEALRRWQPIISMKRNTPRSLKRFLNRVRYLAMKQRGVEPVRSRWEALLARLVPGFGPPPQKITTASDGHIDEGVLVGLCACKYLFPDKNIVSALHLAKEELTPSVRPLPAEEQDLLNYIKGEFSSQAELLSEEFEILHTGLHVY